MLQNSNKIMYTLMYCKSVVQYNSDATMFDDF